MIKYPVEQFIEENRHIYKAEVQKLTGYSRTTLWRKIKSGDFVLPVQRQSGRPVWLFKDVLKYIEDIKTKK